MKNQVYFIILFTAILFSSCRQNPYVVNVNDIEIDFSIKRIEKDLFEGDPSGLTARVENLKETDPDFMRILGYVINIGDPEETNWNNSMLLFVTDKQNVEVYKSVQDVFGGFSGLENDLEDAWKHYRYYFPDKAVPSVYTCLSGFNNSIIVGPDVIGISLDRYLGEDSRFYPMLGIYNYLRRNMVPEKIVPDCMYGWAAASWEMPDNGAADNRLLNHILHQGRLLYFTRLMMPELPDSLLFGFTGQQMQFCDNNEGQMWEYLIEHDLLFSTDQMVIKKLTDNAPFTTYFTSESPGRAANWIGFRIIESYMKRNPDKSLEDLMALNDLSRILEFSAYSP